MTSTTHSGGSPVAPRLLRYCCPDRSASKPCWLETKRGTVQIRKTFVQQGKGADTKPGPLHLFLTAHDERGLDAYLLAHAMASSSDPWDCTMGSDTWVSALGLADAATTASAKTAVSKIMRRLEKRNLIKRERCSAFPRSSRRRRTAPASHTSRGRRSGPRTGGCGCPMPTGSKVTI